MTKHRNSKCDKTQQLKLWQHSKTQNKKNIKKIKYEKTADIICEFPLL